VTGRLLSRYGLREALAISSAEGLESLWARHQRLHQVCNSPSTELHECTWLLLSTVCRWRLPDATWRIKSFNVVVENPCFDGWSSSHQALWDGLRGIGLEPFVEDPAFRLATVNTIKARTQLSSLSHSGAQMSTATLTIFNSSAVRRHTVAGRASAPNCHLL
jgi:hypothetical protein